MNFKMKMYDNVSYLTLHCLKILDYIYINCLTKFQAKELGDTKLVLSDIDDLTGTASGTAALNSELLARFNLIENAINNFSTPDCAS